MTRTPLPLVVAVPFLAAFACGQDPLVKQAVGRLAAVEQREATLPVGDSGAARPLLDDLAWAQKRLGAVVRKDTAEWREASKRLDDVRARIEAKVKTKPAGQPAGGDAAPAFDVAALQQLDKEIGNALANFRRLEVKHLLDPFRSRAAEKELAELTRRVGQFPAADAAVTPVAARLEEYRALHAARLAQLTKDGAAAEATTARLRELDAKYTAAELPGPIAAPFAAEQLRAWSGEVKRWRDVEIPADLAFLATARQNAVVDSQHVERLQHWLAEVRDRRLGEAVRTVADRLAQDVAQGLETAQWLLATDAADRDQVTNRILARGLFDGNMQRLRASVAAIEMARVHDQCMAGAVAPEREAQVALVQRAIVRLQELAVATLDAVRMPAAASTDAGLQRIAAETLGRPEYGVKGWERIVVTADKVRRDSREAWVTGVSTATITYYHYVWDEFQVVTAERIGDEVWLFANHLKYWHSGDTTKPIGKWILSQRFELTRILPENVGK